MHQVSPFTAGRIYLPHLATPLHQYNHSLAELPSCVTPSLDYYRLGPRAPHTTPRKALRGSGG